MAGKTTNISLAIAKQPSADTYVDPTTNYMPISQCRFAIEGQTIASDEYTGTPWKKGDDVSGKRATLSYNVKLRPPGGAAPPAADAWLPGLILQAAKFLENRVTTAIPAAAEAVASGTTTSVTLAAGAAATADLYNGYAISLSDNGATYKARMTAIRDYTAAKVASLMETLSGAPAANYQMPKQLNYFLDATSTDPTLISQELNLDGHRYDLMNCRPSGLQLVVPTSTKNQTLYPELQVSWEMDIYANAAEATPTVAALGAVPFFKDGDAWLSLKALGVETFTIDLGIQTEFPPNPNKVDGVDAAEFVGAQAKLSMTRQKYLPAVIDTLALADAQALHSFFTQWGSAAGAMVQLSVLDCRFNYQSPDTGGALLKEGGDFFIDPYDRVVSLTFPY